MQRKRGTNVMKKKNYRLNFVRVGTEEQPVTIIKSIVRRTIQKELDKYGAVSHNLDEVLDKYIQYPNDRL